MSDRTFSDVTVLLAQGTRIDCHTYPASGPILAVWGTGLSLMLTSGRGAVTAADVDNAHELLEAVQTYVAECERLYAMASESDESRADSVA
ncbi:hypothetical protein [Actinomadura roseirufa]|uniref:hypothetical protein n=1 Tax=Actinomadura roseirufa TaxID=2094049 RepID=UPI00104122BA|nr:hypothetical protein [Actinomadura roseirufa]